MKDNRIIYSRDLALNVAYRVPGTPNSVALELVEQLELAVKQHLAEGYTIRFPGLFTIKPFQGKPRKGRNPRTMQEVTIPAKTRVKFTLDRSIQLPSAL